MALRLADQTSRDLLELVRLERLAFAAKLRMARAMLGWSQSELGFRAEESFDDIIRVHIEDELGGVSR